MEPQQRFGANELNIVTTLREAATAKGLNLDKLSVAAPAHAEKDEWAGQDRHVIIVSDAERFVEWRVNSLSELFRGDAEPPPKLDRFPPEYVPLFFFIEQHVVSFCEGFGDKSDQEFDEIYATLRRRPDGRSLGPIHDFIWQVAAVMLATRVVSRAEFEGVCGALAHSAGRWSVRPISRNYIAYLRNNMNGI